MATDRILTAQFPTSTSIRSASYNATTSVLTIVFRNKTQDGRDTYQYAEFPKREWDKFTSAQSAGSYVQKNVVGKYAEVVTEYDAVAGRAALKLVEEIVDESERRLPGKDLISTSPSFDRAWLARARRALGR